MIYDCFSIFYPRPVCVGYGFNYGVNAFDNFKIILVTLRYVTEFLDLITTGRFSKANVVHNENSSLRTVSFFVGGMLTKKIHANKNDLLGKRITSFSFF